MRQRKPRILCNEQDTGLAESTLTADDVTVLNSVVMQSLFLRSLAAQARDTTFAEVYHALTHRETTELIR